MKHIPNRYFSFSFSMEERWAFIDKYESEDWDWAKSFMNERKPISKNAVLLADKVKDQLDIEVFPYVETIATKGWDLSGGTYAFCMRGRNMRAYYFDWRIKHCLQKRYKLIFEETNLITLVENPKTQSS